MVRIEVRYPGNLHCEARHAPSGVFLHSDAPVDNQGRGESFSPTDLVATALGSCLLTTMGIVANREGIAIEGTSVTVDKIMSTDGPRRIARLIVHLKMAIPRSADIRGAIAAIAQACPVSRSLHPDTVIETTVDWAND